jgi:hypothetical protein
MKGKSRIVRLKYKNNLKFANTLPSYECKGELPTKTRHLTMAANNCNKHFNPVIWKLFYSLDGKSPFGL